MIVIGVDVHKHSLTVVAVDEVVARALSGRDRSAPSCQPGRARSRTNGCGRSRTAGTSAAASSSCCWKRGERLVRVPAWLTAPARRRGGSRGKSDASDAFAVAGAALREPCLDRPRREEPLLRELKLLVDHRDDLVAERRRCRQRLRWHLHELDPSLRVPLGALDRALWLERLGRQLRHEQTTQVRIARDLLLRCRALSRSIDELERELQARTQTIAPRLLELAGRGPLSAAKLLYEIGPIGRFRSDAQLARHAGVAPLEASSGKQRRHRLDRGGNRQLNCALHRIAITQGRIHAPAPAYLERKQSEGKSRAEAIRCPKRQLARTVSTTLRTESALT
jgi:transposase